MVNKQTICSYKLPSNFLLKLTSFEIRDNTENLIKMLVEWLDENPNINANKNEMNLLMFLRSCKYDLERTKIKIQSFYKMRTERTEWFIDRNPWDPKLQELLNIGVFLPLEEKDPENRQVIIIRVSAHCPKQHSQNDVLKVCKMILDILLKMEPDISLNGIVAIFDMKNVQLGHALQMTPTIIKRSVESWQVYPCKPKVLEFINTPTHVNLILNTFRLFMTSKMKSRMSISKKSTSKVDVKLPSDLGGKGKSYAQLAAKWKLIVESNVVFFNEDSKYKSIIT